MDQAPVCEPRQGIQVPVALYSALYYLALTAESYLNRPSDFWRERLTEAVTEWRAATRTAGKGAA